MEEFYSQANFSANDLESFEIIRKTRNLVENPDYMHLIYKGTVDKIDIIRQIDSVSVEKVFDQLAFDNLFITFSTREENFDKTATKTDFETYARQKKSPISLDVHDFARLDREINDEVKGDCTTDQIEFLNSSTDYCQLNCKKIRKLAAQIELYSLVNEFKGDYFVFSNLVLSLVQNDTIYAKEVGEKVVINFDHIKTNVRLFGNTENVLYFVSRFVDSMQKVVKGNVNEKDLRHVKQVIISDMLHDINDNSTKIDQVTLESLNELANNIDQRAGFRLKLIGSLTDEEKEEVQLLTDEIKFTKPYLISHSVDLELSNEEAEVVYLLTSDHFNGLVNLTSDERGFLVVEGETRALEKFLDSIADLNDNKLNKEKELKKKRKEKILKSFNFATENEFKTNGLIFKERRKVFVRTLGIESKGVKQKEKSLKEKLQDLKIEHHEKLLKTI